MGRKLEGDFENRTFAGPVIFGRGPKIFHRKGRLGLDSGIRWVYSDVSSRWGLRIPAARLFSPFGAREPLSQAQVGLISVEI